MRRAPTNACANSGTDFHGDVDTYDWHYDYTDVIADAGAESYADLCADSVANAGAEFQPNIGVDAMHRLPRRR